MLSGRKILDTQKNSLTIDLPKYGTLTTKEATVTIRFTKTTLKLHKRMLFHTSLHDCFYTWEWNLF